MIKENELSASDLVENADSERPSERVIEEAPIGFDAAIYLRAFPDVARAISEGIWSSPLQHYLEHGRREDRTSRASYRALLWGRQIGGCIDLYGHNAHAG